VPYLQTGVRQRKCRVCLEVQSSSGRRCAQRSRAHALNAWNKLQVTCIVTSMQKRGCKRHTPVYATVTSLRLSTEAVLVLPALTPEPTFLPTAAPTAALTRRPPPALPTKPQ